jgi:hypothetical protein
MHWIEFPVEEDAEHFLLFLGLVTAVFGVITWLRNEKKRRDMLQEAAFQAKTTQAEHTNLLKRIDKELHPNNGSTVVDKLVRIEKALIDHVKEADRAFEEAREAREEIRVAQEHADEQLHRRIDGVFELMAGKSHLDRQRIADRHQASRGSDYEAE